MPASGIEIELVAGSPHERPQSSTLGAEDECGASAQVRLPHRLARLAGSAVDPEVRSLDLGEVPRKVGHDRDGHVLDSTGGRAANRGGHHRRAVRRDDHAGRACSFCAARHRAQVARIGDAIETDEQRARLPRELEGVRISIRLDARDDALVITSAGGVGQLPIGLDVDSRPPVLAQPLLGVERALGRPQLEHLARPAQRFPNRAPPVHLLGGHRFGTSW